jgi:hypothetical protein
MNLSKRFFITFVLFLSSICIVPDSPKVDYNHAFNQGTTYQKHAELLTRIGVYKHLKQAGVVPTEKIEFPWDEYKKLNFQERFKNGRSFQVTKTEIIELKSEDDIEAWDPIYGECYPFPWGRYHLLKEESKRKKIADGKINEFSFAEIAYYQGVITKEEYLEMELDTFKKDCLGQLEWERTLSILAPVGRSLGNAAFGLTVSWAARSWGDPKPEINSQMEQAGIRLALYQLKDAIIAPYYVMYPPENPFQNLEERFAQNKCFIPSALWPRIMKSFMLIHKDAVNCSRHMDFLDFSLGLTVHKPKPAIKFTGNRSTEEIKKELDLRIDDFFKDYKAGNKEQVEALENIKLNVFAFIDVLENPNAEVPSCIYLHGPGGIGKTHFMQKLSDWIDELVPQGVAFENLVIDSAERLEGNIEQRGVFLEVLHNQLAQGKHASFVKIDEASWINTLKPEMNDAIKRTFDIKNRKLLAPCLGSDIDGAIQLEKPLMLIVLAGNVSPQKIQEKATRSRFLSLNFPSPDVPVLAREGLKIIKNSNNVDQERKSCITEEDVSNWIKTLPESNQNFRYVANNVVNKFKKNNG